MYRKAYETAVVMAYFIMRSWEKSRWLEHGRHTQRMAARQWNHKILWADEWLKAFSAGALLETS
jgi:hypothetical protein